MDDWKVCDAPIDVASIKGNPCFGGLDLSTIIDITALTLLFPPYKERKRWVVLPFFWIPEDNMEQRVKCDRGPRVEEICIEVLR